MHLFSMPTPLATLLLLAAAVTPSQATMAAWLTDIGPQVILQNETTGLIQYSACNSRGEPRYSPTEENTFLLDEYIPKKGTPLTGSGYYNDPFTVTSLYYIDENDNIVNAVFNCNMETGLFDDKVGNWIISSVVPAPLWNNSGLAVVLLGNKAGFRLYYHDENQAVNELKYTTDGGWLYQGIITQDPQGAPAIAAAFSGNVNISVITARDPDNMEVTTYHDDESWHISTFPHPLEGDLITMDTNSSDIKINATAKAKFLLPSWIGNPGALGMSIDSKYTRSVWYIGNDKNLYWVAAKRNTSWSHQNSQSDEFWPRADQQNAPLAVASDRATGKLYIYYTVNGQIAEVRSLNGDWKEWRTLAAPEPAKVEDGSNSGGGGVNDGGDSKESLSSGAKIGLGVGVSLGVVGIIAIVAVVLVMRRKRAAGSGSGGNDLADGATAEAYKPIVSFDGSPSTQYSGYVSPTVPGQTGYDHYAWDKKVAGELPPADVAGVHQLDTISRPAELYSPQPMYELSDQTYSHELMAEGQQAQRPTAK